MSRSILFLDDDPERHRLIAKSIPTARHVHTAFEAIEMLKRKPWDVVMLDYDLDQFGAHDPGNGEDVVNWVLKNKKLIRHPLFIVHSHNWLFGPAMFNTLRDAGFSVLRYRAAETDPFFLSKVRCGDFDDIANAIEDPDNLKIPTQRKIPTSG